MDQLKEIIKKSLSHHSYLELHKESLILCSSKEKNDLTKIRLQAIDELLKEKIKKVTPEELKEISEYFASETKRLNDSIKRLKKTDN